MNVTFFLAPREQVGSIITVAALSFTESFVLQPQSHICAFPVAESVDFDGFRGFITQFSSHWSDCSMEKRYEKIVLNATERVSGANDRNVSWNEMDGGEHHSQAWTSHHGWLHRAISLSRGHLIFQAHSTWWALRQWKLHLDGHSIHLMSLGRRTLIYFDHLWSLESVTRHTYKSYKAHLKLYLWCCPLQEWKSRAWKTPGGYLWRLQRAPFLFSSFFGLRGGRVVRSTTLRSARLYQLLLGVVALCEPLNAGSPLGAEETIGNLVISIAWLCSLLSNSVQFCITVSLLISGGCMICIVFDHVHFHISTTYNKYQ